ncbi:MAG: DNA polymerase III subunit gamma/tau [Acutalibacteraceae bacterium]|nr:DNA polymerase III subunit gamma/tau [Acutalibacteraceae bacterium]
MYQALYRKYRPRTFTELCGQDHVSRTLKSQVESGTASHAYLFCGSRGTGKTSSAKILSKALNCLHPQNGDPCNECEMCKGIDNGSVMDVFEIDAASNRGIDDIRDLRDKIAYAPAQAKFKVYIIDEVHMLTDQAFNALLKTIEEPPSHAVFILATTESHKIPATIMSRCQRYDFSRIASETIAERIIEVCGRKTLNVMPTPQCLLRSLQTAVCVMRCRCLICVSDRVKELLKIQFQNVQASPEDPICLI